MNHAGPPVHRQPDLVVSTKLPPDARKKHEAYVAKGGWRCEKSPKRIVDGQELDGAHWAVNGICKYCEQQR